MPVKEPPMENLFKTILHDRHVELGAQMVEFGGWSMPIQYPQGIVHEHLATRRHAGLFDVSHMGRFTFRGQDALPFLQHVLSNNAAGLEQGESQYTLIPNDSGGAIDDAYLYRFHADEYLLVVNASNRLKDWDHFQSYLPDFKNVTMKDKTKDISMLSLQGPISKDILQKIIDSGALPEPMRNHLSIATIQGKKVLIARTGYTGEPLCFELFIDSADTSGIWNLLIDQGAQPVGLGARDTLRLEAGLPLYGHELGMDPDNQEIPVYASPLSRFAVSLSPLKKDFIGRKALEKQFEAFKKIADRDYSLIHDLPRCIMPVALKKKSVARAGYKVFQGKSSCRVCHQRYHDSEMGDRGAGYLLEIDRRSRSQRNLPGTLGQHAGGRRRHRGRNPGQTGVRGCRSLSHAQRSTPLCQVYPLGQDWAGKGITGQR